MGMGNFDGEGPGVHCKVSKEAQVRGGANVPSHEGTLAPPVEYDRNKKISVCDGDADLCQITLTTCYYWYFVFLILGSIRSRGITKIGSTTK